MSVLVKLSTYRRLGLANVARVAWYSFRLKIGWFKRTQTIAQPVQGEFFEPLSKAKLESLSKKYADFQLLESPLLFGWIALPTNTLPNWHKSVLTKQVLPCNKQHWSDISDFSSGVGDIKGIWEVSRFQWSLLFTQRYLQEQQIYSLAQLNQWLNDWAQHNPANQGVNWKCAQEVSLRVLHLAACALLMQQKTPTPSTVKLISQHLTRIMPTLGYAKAQDNNHGTSEAAALYIGGSWLLRHNPQNQQAKKWQKLGRRYLSERVNRLILADGSFSQYSCTYHRLLLDSLNLVELWRDFLGLPIFSEPYIKRVQQAIFWLEAMVNPESGDAPNLGANDGAHILNFANTGYRDFRPTLALSNLLFNQRLVYPNQSTSWLAQLFNLSASASHVQQQSWHFSDGGFSTLAASQSWCLLRIPKYRFRPSQADCLHLDLWVNNQNVLLDGGSYNYNSEQKWLDYFSGIASHNSVQFDHQQPMPKISRFLYGQWPQASLIEQSANSVTAEYRTYQNALHNRQVKILDKSIVITDTLSGSFKHACLRWRLFEQDWQVEKHSVFSDDFRVSVEATDNISSFTLAEGFESRYYGKKTPIFVLEIGVKKSMQIKTTISWQ
ncbi:heparinase II/III family protein [Paraglaciecola aestuariivivens]